MGAGLRYVAMSPNILKVLLRGFLFGLTAIAVLALLPLVARHLVQGGPLVYGSAARRLRRRRGRRRLHRQRGCASGCRARRSCALAFAGFAVCARGRSALSPSAWLDRGSAMLVGGACWVLALALFNTTVQLSTPRWVVGRALVALPDGGLRRHGARQLALGRRRRAPRRRRRRCSAAAAAMLVGGARRPAGCRCRRGPSSTSTRSTAGSEPQVAIDIEAAQRPDPIDGRIPDRRRGRRRIPRA